MTTHSTLPVYPVPARETQVIFALTESGTNLVRVWVTAAPQGSALRTKLDESGQNRIEVARLPGGAGSPWRNIFEVGGKYTLVAQEYISGASDHGGGYEGSPDANPSETKVGAEATLSIYIGQRMTSTIAAGSDSVDVVLWVWNDTIRATTTDVQGEISPAVIKESPNPRELAVIESTAVRTALDGLVDELVADVVGTPSTVFGLGTGGFVKEFNDHLSQATVHQSNDTDNVIPVGLAGAAAATNLKDAVNEALTYIRQHYLNDAVKGGTVFGRDSGDYHNVSGKKNDNVNLPLVQSAGDEAGAYWALADVIRSYEAHRFSSIVHDNADGTNGLSAPPPLLNVGIQIFTVWAATAPTTPPTQSSGAMTLIAKAGFAETPLET